MYLIDFSGSKFKYETNKKPHTNQQKLVRQNEKEQDTTYKNKIINKMRRCDHGRKKNNNNKPASVEKR